MRAKAWTFVGVLVIALAAGLLYFDIQILGGDAAPNHPSVVKFHAGSPCTGTVVGTRTVLTAAHCFADRKVPDVKIEIEGRGPVMATCWRHEDFIKEPTNDVAVCTLKDDSRVAPRRVSRRVASGKGQRVVFMGFGCVRLKWRLERGVRRKGTGTATLQPSGVLEITGNGICGGDSGGPVFAGGETGALIAVLSGKRGGTFQGDAWTTGAGSSASWLGNFKGAICFEGDVGPQCSAVSPKPVTENRDRMHSAQAARATEVEVLR